MASNLIRRLKLQSETLAPGGNVLRSNKDLDPVPFESEQRKWTWPSLLGFWIAEAFSISMYQVASSSITKGLSPGLAILAVLVGHVLVCIPAVLNGYVGCIYGINFPFLMRSTFGIYGAYFAVFVRGVVACIWFGTQSFQGGQSKGFRPTFSKGTHITDGTPTDVVFFQCVITAIGPKATLALIMPDFTRYAKYPKQVFWTQAVGLCVLVTLCVESASSVCISELAGRNCCRIRGLYRAGKILPVEEKFEEGQVMDGVDGSSLAHSDPEEMEIPANEKSTNF
ncbi:hypothetical protein G7Y89_g10672 [Cudoniella acicularis]|uniref:Uncharacterized protein n=1 Tax=Cudoniella acicularis TaxID=354080 RepID=A0A8H4REM0_9HELO|nr:hypothetical protein G7Y89_g10672 [Cudoniella acicularis]